MVKAAICVRQSEHTAHGVRTQPLCLVHVSAPESGSHTQMSPVLVVMSHMRSALLHWKSAWQAPGGRASVRDTPGTLRLQHTFTNTGSTVLVCFQVVMSLQAATNNLCSVNICHELPAHSFVPAGSINSLHRTQVDGSCVGSAADKCVEHTAGAHV